MNKIDEKKMIQLLINSDDTQELDEFIETYGVDAVDRDGRTFLMSAVAKNNLQLTSYLIEKGYELSATDKQGLTSLHIAALHDFHDMTDLLLDNGAEIDPVDNWGNTPLWRAAMNSQDVASLTARLLLDRGADKNRKSYSDVAPMDLLPS